MRDIFYVHALFWSIIFVSLRCFILIFAIVLLYAAVAVSVSIAAASAGAAITEASIHIYMVYLFVSLMTHP